MANRFFKPTQKTETLETLLKKFSHAYVRDHRGGKEIRVNNLEESIHVAQDFIKRNNLNLEIIDRNPILKSFTVIEKP